MLIYFLTGGLIKLFRFSLRIKKKNSEVKRIRRNWEIKNYWKRRRGKKIKAAWRKKSIIGIKNRKKFFELDEQNADMNNQYTKYLIL